MLSFLIAFCLTTQQASAAINCQSQLMSVMRAMLNLEQKGYKIEDNGKYLLTSQVPPTPEPLGYIANGCRNVNGRLDCLYRMDGTSAMLMNGCLPPQSRYFGYGTYLHSKASSTRVTGASFTDNINQNSVKGLNGKTYDTSAAFITTADNITLNDIRESLLLSGVSSQMVNEDIINASHVKLGTSSSADRLRTLMRSIIGSSDLSDYYNNINHEWHTNVFFITKITNSTEYETKPRVQATVPTRKEKECKWVSSRDQTQDESEFTSTYDQLATTIKDTMRNKFYYELKYEKSITAIDTNHDYCLKHNTECKETSTDALTWTYTSQVPFDKHTTFITTGINHAHPNVRAATLLQESTYYYTSPWSKVITSVDDTYLRDSAFGWGHYNPNNQGNLWADIERFTSVVYTRPGMCLPDLVQKGIKCIEISESFICSGCPLTFVVRSHINQCTGTAQLAEQTLDFRVMTFNNKDVYDYYYTWTIVTWVCIGLCIACIVPFLLYLLIDCCCDDDDSC